MRTNALAVERLGSMARGPCGSAFKEARMTHPNRPRGVPCAHCDGRRLVWNVLLGKSIPCPQCRRKPRQDPSGINAITAAEKRRMNRLVARAVGLEIAAAVGSRVRQVDPYLATTDRIMQRWAVGHGSGLPKTDEDWDKAVVKALDADVFSPEPSRPPGLDDATQVVIDLIVHGSPVLIKAFVRQWYLTDVPCVVLAQQRGIHHEDVYMEWRATLNFLRVVFLGSPHADLVALVNGRL